MKFQAYKPDTAIDDPWIGKHQFKIIGVNSRTSYKSGLPLLELALERPEVPFIIRGQLIFGQSFLQKLFIEEFFSSISLPFPQNGEFDETTLIGKVGLAEFYYIQKQGSLRPSLAVKRYLKE